MGRRKIEIRPIKDDRNRSVTFLKRKGGLFKKAYELGVLCQVDVAVIIFGHNKKLYEFCSGDINDTIGRFQYYAGAHEHKGPADFAGKGGGDDDEDEDGDMGSPPANSNGTPEPTQMTHNLHNQPGLQHIRHSTPSESPSMGNGNIPMQARGSTPQPSRPASRAAMPAAMPRRPSNLGPTQFTPPQAQMTQPYGYAQAQAQAPAVQYYNPPQGAIHRSSQGSFSGPTQPQLQQAYMQDERRASVPPPQPSPRPTQTQHRNSESQSRKPSPQPEQAVFQSPPLPQPKPISTWHSKSHSIFTPIENSSSLLAQHWGAPPEAAQLDHKNYHPRSQPVDPGVRERTNVSPPQTSQGSFVPVTAPHTIAPIRTASTSSNASIPNLSRSNTIQSDAKRPRLKVQIPSEQSDGDEATATADSSEDLTSSTTSQAIPNKGVVLPPPSPSTNGPLLSAGASGPPNPFARPAFPSSQNLGSRHEQIETPLSALPSRVMDSHTLPSPSDLWANMFSRSNDNMMPSPLRFEPTPIHQHGPSFRDELPAERKRSGDDLGPADSKRIKA